MSDESKELQLVRAICKVKNLAKELGLPDLIIPEADRLILEAGDPSTWRWGTVAHYVDGVLHFRAMTEEESKFLDAPDPVTKSIQ